MESKKKYDLDKMEYGFSKKLYSSVWIHAYSVKKCGFSSVQLGVEMEMRQFESAVRWLDRGPRDLLTSLHAALVSDLQVFDQIV